MRRLWAGMLALLFCSSALAQALTIEELQASGQLHISSTLSPDANVIPGQRLKLTLEVSTNSWFTGGTRIAIPEVAGLVILQTEQFASNASETRQGQTWVIQRWTLDIFPQRAGEFTVPAIPVQVQVNGGTAGDIQGELLGPSRKFSVTLPDSLATAEHWVAAPAFTVSQQFDRNLEGLAVGDAFEQEIQFEAEDVLAMMLPSYEADRPDGLAVYPLPPVLDNSNNRGVFRASRTVKISYIVEQPGQYLLPSRDYFWWNTEVGELELLTVPETRIEVSGAGAIEQGSTAIDKQRLLLILAGLVIGAISLRLAVTRLPRLPWQKTAALFSALVARWQTLRQPALPARLNPDGSAGPQRAAPRR